MTEISNKIEKNFDYLIYHSNNILKHIIVDLERDIKDEYEHKEEILHRLNSVCSDINIIENMVANYYYKNGGNLWIMKFLVIYYYYYLRIKNY